MKRFFSLLLLAFAVLAPHHVFAASVGSEIIGPANVSVGQDFQMTIQFRAMTDIDTVRLIGSYSQDLVQWEGIRPSGMFQNVSPGSTVDEQLGTFSFGTFTFGPTAKGTDKIAVITFKALKAGTAMFRLLAGTEAYSAGEPTGMSLGSASVIIGGAVPVSLPESLKALPVTTPAITAFTISSATHPDSSKWYASPNVEVSWNAEKPITSVLGSFDQSPVSLSYTSIQTPTASFVATSDGIWYVHLFVMYSDKTFGLADFMVRIDQTSPHTLTPVVEQTNIPSTFANGVTFGTLDEMSGVDHYDVLIDGQYVTSTRQTFYPLINQSIGTHTIEIVAVDRAGNRQSEKASFTVIGIAQAKKLMTIQWFWILTLSLVVCIGGIWYAVVRLHRR